MLIQVLSEPKYTLVKVQTQIEIKVKNVTFYLR